MPAIGGEIEQLSALQSTFNTQSGAVEDLKRILSGQLSNTVWQGPAADRFRSSWESDFSPALVRLAQALNDAGTEVARRRDALVQAGS